MQVVRGVPFRADTSPGLFAVQPLAQAVAETAGLLNPVLGPRNKQTPRTQAIGQGVVNFRLPRVSGCACKIPCAVFSSSILFTIKAKCESYAPEVPE